MQITVTIFLFLAGYSSVAQTLLSGTVREKSGAAIVGANILIEDTYEGTTSDANGSFAFSTDEAGQRRIVVTCIGFKSFVSSVILSGEPITLMVVLQEEISELEAVTIYAGSYTASDENRRTIFSARDIATTAGATADIAGALNTLPGTQKVGETGRLFVRGGDGDEARTFIDGMLVLDAYNTSAPNTPSRGRFLPFMFKGSSFSTGGYSAEYGQALSSALILDSRDKAESTRTDFGFLSVGADVTHTHVWERSSAAAKLQYTNIRPYFNLIEQETDWIEPPTSLEVSSTFRQQIGEEGILKIFGNVNRSDFSLYQHDIDDYSSTWKYELANDYRYINASYKSALNERWLVRGGISYNYIKNDNLDKVEITTRDKGTHAKAVVEGSIGDNVELRSGVEVIDRVFRQKTGAPEGGSDNAFHETISAAFAEVDIYLSNQFVTRAGGRFEYNSLLNYFSADPRISFGYQLRDKGTLSLAYGRFIQSPKTQFLKLNQPMTPESSTHLITSYQYINNNRTFRAEAYYKQYDNLIKYTDRAEAGMENSGTGYAKGIEFFWRDNQTLKNTDYWISYSYLDTKRNYLDFPFRAVPSFASAHNFSAVYKYFFTKLKSQFGATYSFTSGRPYNDPNTSSYNAERTPAYHDLSINVAFLPRPNLIVYASVTNVPGRDNIFGYEYSELQNSDGTYNRRAITQPAPRFIFIGIFLTLSKDKTINQMPTL